MPTVIDSLIVTLGLDPSNFNKGSKAAAAAFLGTREEMRRTGKEVETSAKNSDLFLSKLQSRALTLFAVFSGGKGIAAFASSINAANVATGRASELFGKSASVISSWAGVVQATGGDGKAAAASLIGLNNELQNMAVTGDSKVLPYLRALGISIQGANGQIMTAEEALPRFAEAISRAQAQYGTAYATNMARGLGLSDDLTIVMLRGRKALDDYMADQQRWGVITDKQARGSQQLTYAMTGMERSFDTLGRQVMEHLNPGLTSLANRLTDLFVAASNNGWIDKLFGPLEAAEKKAEGELSRFWKIVNGPHQQTEARKKLLAEGAKNDKAETDTSSKAGNVLEELFFKLAGRPNDYDKVSKDFEESLSKDRKARLAADSSHETKNEKALEAIVGRPLAKLVSALVGDDTKAIVAAQNAQAQGDVGGAGGGAIGGGVAALNSAIQKQRFAQGVAYYQSKGWSRENAIGIMTNFYRESGLDEKSVGDNGLAIGIGQWHPDRQANFERVFGKKLKNATYEEQLAFGDWELNNSEKRAGDLLRGERTSYGSAYTVSKASERPLNAIGEARARGEAARVFDAELKKNALENAVNAQPLPVDYGAPTAAQWSAGGSTANDNSKSTTVTITGGLNVTVPPGSDGKAIGEAAMSTVQGVNDSDAIHADYAMR